MQPETFAITLAELRDVAQACSDAKVPYAVSGVATIVATLCAFAGPHGSTGQRNAMDAATKAGFTPEYYGDGIRVTFNPKGK